MATGISISSTSNLSTGQKILVAAAKMAYEPAAPNPDLVANERIPQGHKQWDVLSYARLATATALTEGVDLGDIQQLVTATLTITPTENGLIATLSNRLIRRQGDVNIISATGKLLANSLRRKQDTDIITVYDTFTKSIVGAGSPLDVTYFRGAVAYLRTDNSSTYGPAPMPLRAALHIEQISDIIADITDPGTVVSSRFGWSQEMMQQWWRARDRLYAVEVFESGNITRDASDDSKGAIIAEDAIHQVMANNADVTEQEDKSLRAVEYGIFQEWGTSLRADPHGVEVYSDTLATV